MGFSKEKAVSAMKREVVYTSETVLPDELRNLLLDVQKCVMRDRFEEDKILIHFSWLKHRLIEWLLNHEKT
jgi:hypothetical protein